MDARELGETSGETSGAGGTSGLGGPGVTGGETGGTGELRYRMVELKNSAPGVRPCSLAAALGVVGEKWSLLALREMAYGVHSFARIVGYTGAPRDVLTDRLRKLEAAGVVERRLYNEHPPRYEYHLTQAGQELFPVMISLLTWGAKWAQDTPTVLFRHDCGQQVELDLRCAHCGEPVTRESLTAVKSAPAGVAADTAIDAATP